jgi:hypothetical protein
LNTVGERSGVWPMLVPCRSSCAKKRHRPLRGLASTARNNPMRRTAGSRRCPSSGLAAGTGDRAS